MSNPSYQLDHVCLAVRKIAPARAVLERTLGYRARTEPVLNTRQQVVVQFMQKEGSLDIKLIEPAGLDSPLVDFIKRSGGGLHHLAFKTETVADGVADLESKGAKIITAPQPGEAFDEAQIAFTFLGAGLNVELIDTDARRNVIAAAIEATRSSDV
ncbi:VOC family protein [Steroidobacter sp.]|uniref:VOC family protein n=1 Tax=Steroidobacter sp. TaxID=1978227 RepID=UPI001A56C0BF|nr:VOC family protein [Steroidobacter sp.]MBL8269754.1 VOC family protein [Steroidobacter sp.]